MKIIVNKKPITIPHDFTVTELLQYMNYPKLVAVFINGKQLLLAQYKDHRLRENEDVKVIRILGGG